MKRKKRSSHGKRSQAAIEVPPGLSLRTMEREMARIGRLVRDRDFDSEEEMSAFIQSAFADKTLERAQPSTPLNQAQELIYDAWDSPSREKAIRLARKALALSPDCADAYVFFAEQEEVTLEEACELYAQGVAAAARALGEEFFAEHRGDFWGFVETRPYMRARLGLAQCLWDLGENEQAVEGYQEMMKLNPNDNQGVRYLLLACFVDLGGDADALQLLAEYPDEGSAVWLYTDALLAFRREGDAKRSGRALVAAVNENPHVPDYLLRRVAMTDPVPDVLSIGEESEAFAYTAQFRDPWRRSTGALTWMRGVLSRTDLNWRHRDYGREP